MKSSHGYVRFLALKILFVMVLILEPAWAELTPRTVRPEMQDHRVQAYAQQSREVLAKTAEERTAQQSRTRQNAPTLVTAKAMIADPSRIRITVNFATNQADILPQYRGQLDELGKAIQQMAGLSF